MKFLPSFYKAISKISPKFHPYLLVIQRELSLQSLYSPLPYCSHPRYFKALLLLVQNKFLLKTWYINHVFCPQYLSTFLFEEASSHFLNCPKKQHPNLASLLPYNCFQNYSYIHHHYSQIMNLINLIF